MPPPKNRILPSLLPCFKVKGQGHGQSSGQGHGSRSKVKVVFLACSGRYRGSALLSVAKSKEESSVHGVCLCVE